VLAENLPAPMVRVGIEDEFSQSGLITPERDDLKIHFGLRAEDLVVSVKECIAKKERLRCRE
jgi:transketolase C-terminal domain/subunit